MKTKRAVLYARISVSADESVSVKRQLKTAADYAELRKWEVVGTFVDDGVSATHSKPEDRAGWSSLLAAGEPYDVVIVWKVDRLARRVLDFLNADQALQARGAAVVAVEDPVDMSTAQGRAFATILAVFAEMEADNIRARVKAARVELIGRGRVAAGMAPYGYYNKALDGGGFVLAKDPVEGPFVVEAVSRYMAGESMYALAQDFAAREVPTKRRRGTWHNSTLQKIFENPVLAGMTPYNPGNGSKVRGDAVLRGTDGMPVIREDLAVLSLAEYRALRERMATRTLRKVNGTDPLLSGLAVCDRCEARMYRAGMKGGEGYIGRYKCRVCNAYVSHLEAEVERQFLDSYGDHTVMTLFGDEILPVESEYDLAEIEQQIRETGKAITVPGADIAALADRLQALTDVREKAAAEVSEVVVVSVPDDVRTVREQWETGTLDEKRDLLSHVAGQIRVKPSEKGLTLADRVAFRDTSVPLMLQS